MLDPTKKTYKVGQLVTINNKVYRILQSDFTVGCILCDLCKKQCVYNLRKTDCDLNPFLHQKCTNVIGFDGYFKLVRI